MCLLNKNSGLGETHCGLLASLEASFLSNWVSLEYSARFIVMQRKGRSQGAVWRPEIDVKCLSQLLSE